MPAPRRPRHGTPPSRRDCGSRFRSGGTRCPRRGTVLPWYIAAQSASSAPSSLARRPSGPPTRDPSRGPDLPAALGLARTSSLFNAFPVVLAGPGFIAARSGALACSRQTKSLSPTPLRPAERLRRPFQESARRDFEPLAPNLFKLGQHLPFVKA